LGDLFGKFLWAGHRLVREGCRVARSVRPMAKCAFGKACDEDF
jgi:hypothetical protein